jgi:hypothetical protein
MMGSFLQNLIGYTPATPEVPGGGGGTAASWDTDQLFSTLGFAGSALGLTGGGGSAPSGYQGSVPNYDAVRQTVPNTYDPNRRPGSGGQRYFTDMQYQAPGTAAAPMSAEGLAIFKRV